MANKGNKPPSHILLDQFTERDLTSWKKFSDQYEEYAVREFFHLESLRTLKHSELCESLSNTKSKSINEAGWFRIVDAQYTNCPLSAKGSLIESGRFNIGKNLSSDTSFTPFPALYIAENYDTAYAEKFGIVEEDGQFTAHELGLRQFTSFSAYAIQMDLCNLFDLTKAINLKKFSAIISKFKLPFELLRLRKELGIKQKALITSQYELRNGLLDANWRYYPKQYELPSNSQIFARLIKDSGFDGIIYPSTKYSGKNCVALFLENLEKSESSIELTKPVAKEIEHQRLDTKNWKKLL